jgi:hypothetical protein
VSERSIRVRWGASRLVGSVIVVSAIASFALSRILWPTPTGMPGPPSRLLPGFVVLAAVESIVFGLGVGFVCFGRPLLGDRTRGAALTRATHLSIAWLLISWWPHDNFHRVLAHDDWAGLLRIEYGFHLTLIAAAVITAAYFLRIAHTEGSQP